jgi:peptidoglycan/xylan/chitin deacetylase (PgdA/CDA1 family)
MSLINRIKTLALAAAFSLPIFIAPIQASAATQSVAPAAKVSFTFDDGYTSALAQAAPTLAKYGMTGTDYAISGCVGMVMAPNTCRADNDKTYMTWDQITQLKNNYGWEIGSHTVTHPYLATSDATDGQPNVLTPAQVTQELSQSKADFAAHGINTTDFATPYGDYNMPVLAQIAKYYSSQRGFADIGYNTWPNSDYFLREQQVQGGVSVATVKGYVDNAIKNNQWLVLVFHDIKTKASNKADDYEYSTANLDQIAAYVKSKNVPAVNINNGLVTSDVNMLPNASFNNGIADGWTTDAPATITPDNANNGSYPDPTNSAKLVSSGATSHLFSPQVTVDPNTSYMLKNFLNVQKLTSGEVGFYVDEYDGFGNWISGQYKAAERSVFVEELNFNYKPSSANVSKARLQVIVTGNSGITAYLDNTQWFPLQVSTPTPPPTQTNLVANGTFDSGISGGWRSDDPVNIVADSANNGSPSNPVNSVKLAATSKNTHLFSPQVAVDSTKSYSLNAYLNLKQITSGEVGFYVDEYDANGNWISGKYITGVRAIGAGNVSFAYTPSSASVKTASLQVIVVANSNILAYIDDVRWYAN